LDILKEKKAGAPPQVQKKMHPRQKHLSKEYITDEDAAEDIPQNEGGVCDDHWLSLVLIVPKYIGSEKSINMIHNNK
jgi:hypothetical protein